MTNNTPSIYRLYSNLHIGKVKNNIHVYTIILTVKLEFKLNMILYCAKERVIIKSDHKFNKGKILL